MPRDGFLLDEKILLPMESINGVPCKMFSTRYDAAQNNMRVPNSPCCTYRRIRSLNRSGSFVFLRSAGGLLLFMR